MLEENTYKDVRVVGLDYAKEDLYGRKACYDDNVFQYMVVVDMVGAFILSGIWIFSTLKFLAIAAIFIGYNMLALRLTEYVFPIEYHDYVRAKREIERLERMGAVEVKYTILEGLSTTETTIWVNGVKSEYINAIVHKPHNDCVLLDYGANALVLNV